MHELYRKHRPRRLKDIVGQDDAVKVLEAALANGGVPHALLLAGPSGTGKTTLARILSKRLDCLPIDFDEINCAGDGNIENMKRLRQRMSLAPMGGKVKIYYLDESANLTYQAQESLLKALEDTPSHVYFFLATTDPHKLKRTILTRCTTIKLQPISNKAMAGLLNSVLEKEGKEISNEVIERIVEAADGSAREALVLLQKVYLLPTEDEQLANVCSSALKDKSIELCRALIFGKDWGKVAVILKEVEGEEAEKLRRMVLGYARSVLIGKQPKHRVKAAYVIECFRENVFDSGHAGLASAAWEVVNTK